MKTNYVAVRGTPGYLHVGCWPEYRKQVSRYDAQGWAVSAPMLNGQYETLPEQGGHKDRCLHCKEPLTLPTRA